MASRLCLNVRGYIRNESTPGALSLDANPPSRVAFTSFGPGSPSSPGHTPTALRTPCRLHMGGAVYVEDGGALGEMELRELRALRVDGGRMQYSVMSLSQSDEGSFDQK